jgi:glycosyltransferase involved in cell wall biosynthesis
VGVDWARKGGDIAVAIAQRLNDEGLPTELTIVGCRPDRARLPDFVNVAGFLDKHTAEGRTALDAFYARSHFLLLPSRAEAYGLVLAEACAFGVSCIASDVGGIPTIVRNGVNGMTFDPSEIGPACSYIEESMANRSQYEQLAVSSFAEYEARLNWDVAGRVVKGLIEERL